MPECCWAQARSGAFIITDQIFTIVFLVEMVTLSHSLSHTHTLSHTLAHTHTLIHSHTLSHTLTHSHTLSHSLTLSHTLTDWDQIFTIVFLVEMVRQPLSSELGTYKTVKAASAPGGADHSMITCKPRSCVRVCESV